MCGVLTRPLSTRRLRLGLPASAASISNRRRSAWAATPIDDARGLRPSPATVPAPRHAPLAHTRWPFGHPREPLLSAVSTRAAYAAASRPLGGSFRASSGTPTAASVFRPLATAPCPKPSRFSFLGPSLSTLFGWATWPFPSRCAVWIAWARSLPRILVKLFQTHGTLFVFAERNKPCRGLFS